MKHYLSALLAVTLLAGLTACGGIATPAADVSKSPTATASATPSPSPSPSHKSRPVPDVTGKKFVDARKILNDADLWGYAWGKDGKRWSSGMAPEDAIVTSTVPAAGTMTGTRDININVDTTEAAYTKAATDAAKMAKRYDFTCGGSWQPSGSALVTFHTLKEVWASKFYSNSDTCSVKIDGGYAENATLIPSEQAVVDIVTANGGGSSNRAASEFETVMRLCVKLDRDYADKVVARMDWRKAEAKAALNLCPDAPHVALLKEAVDSVKVDDGTYTVGKTLEPGTYRTKPSIKDCYWSRTTGSGQIIANDFVGFAPDGITVTVYAGEGFESKYCGVWTKIG